MYRERVGGFVEAEVPSLIGVVRAAKWVRKDKSNRACCTDQFRA